MKFKAFVDPFPQLIRPNPMVPTMGAWGMAIVALGLLWFGILRLRKSRAATLS